MGLCAAVHGITFIISFSFRKQIMTFAESATAKLRFIKGVTRLIEANLPRYERIFKVKNACFSGKDGHNANSCFAY